MKHQYFKRVILEAPPPPPRSSFQTLLYSPGGWWGGAEAEQGEGRRARSTWKWSGRGPRQSQQSRKPGQSQWNWSPPGRSGRDWSPPGRSRRDWSPPVQRRQGRRPPRRSGRQPDWKRLNTPFRNTISLIIMNQGIQYLFKSICNIL